MERGFEIEVAQNCAVNHFRSLGTSARVFAEGLYSPA